MNKTSVSRLMVAVDGFVAATALAGGAALAAGLEDDNLGLELLEGTPFDSYLAPGILLATAVGGSAAVATAASVRDGARGGRVSVVAGLVLAGWIVGEVVVLDQPEAPTGTELFYLAAAATMVALGIGSARSSRTVERKP